LKGGEIVEYSIEIKFNNGIELKLSDMSEEDMDEYTKKVQSLFFSPNICAIETKDQNESKKTFFRPSGVMSIMISQQNTEEKNVIVDVV
jgi:hypothetical protein